MAPPSTPGSGEQQLKEGVERQLARLKEELNDLEEARDDLSPTEYAELKADVLQQQKETEATFARLDSGAAMLGQQRVASDVSGDARLFTKDRAAQLRDEIASLHKRYLAGSVPHYEYTSTKVSLLEQLSREGRMSEAEQSFLSTHSKGPALQQAAVATHDMHNKVLEMAARKS